MKPCNLKLAEQTGRDATREVVGYRHGNWLFLKTYKEDEILRVKERAMNAEVKAAANFDIKALYDKEGEIPLQEFTCSMAKVT